MDDFWLGRAYLEHRPGEVGGFGIVGLESDDLAAGLAEGLSVDFAGDDPGVVVDVEDGGSFLSPSS